MIEKTRSEKKIIIDTHEACAYISACGGIEIHYIENGINDFVYFVAGAWCAKKSYHKAKIYYNNNGAYFRYNGYTLNFNEAIKM